MKDKDKILAEVEEMGRLRPEQEDILYSISLKQDELGRESSNMLLSKVKEGDLYPEMIERGYLTYEIFNHGGKHEIASLYVTLKGLRYCIVFADEIADRRRTNSAGALR